MIKTTLNFGLLAGWFTYLTATDVIAIVGGTVGIIFTTLRVFSLLAERKKRKLEIELLLLKIEKEKDS
ncbi:hypothetical protein N9043_00655 [bacterium]|nr:hypothetical protein [bacterium]